MSTCGAAKTARACAGFSGIKIGVHPSEESNASASVRTPPSSRVIDESLLHAVLGDVSGTANAAHPSAISSS